MEDDAEILAVPANKLTKLYARRKGYTDIDPELFIFLNTIIILKMVNVRKLGWFKSCAKGNN